jgi:NAD(P)-dependent dehydrogenase (short-subunit alcohol dehydrogenase family)
MSIITTWVDNGSPFVVPSAMSKAGIEVMTKSLAVEWAPTACA